MQLLSKFNKWSCFLLCSIDIFSKYACVVLSKDKKVLELLMLFKKTLMNLDGKQIRSGLIKVVDFTISQ